MFDTVVVVVVHRLFNFFYNMQRVFQGRTCSDNGTCCHAEIEVADQTCYLIQCLFLLGFFFFFCRFSCCFLYCFFLFVRCFVCFFVGFLLLFGFFVVFVVAVCCFFVFCLFVFFWGGGVLLSCALLKFEWSFELFDALLFYICRCSGRFCYAFHFCPGRFCYAFYYKSMFCHLATFGVLNLIAMCITFASVVFSRLLVICL